LQIVKETKYKAKTVFDLTTLLSRIINVNEIEDKENQKNMYMLAVESGNHELADFLYKNI